MLALTRDPSRSRSIDRTNPSLAHNIYKARQSSTPSPTWSRRNVHACYPCRVCMQECRTTEDCICCDGCQATCPLHSPWTTREEITEGRGRAMAVIGGCHYGSQGRGGLAFDPCVRWLNYRRPRLLGWPGIYCVPHLPVRVSLKADRKTAWWLQHCTHSVEDRTAQLHAICCSCCILFPRDVNI